MMQTPRTRTEIEQRPTLRTPRPIPLVRLQTTAATIATARADADMLVMNLWVSNVTAGAITYSIRLVASGGSPSSANSIIEGRSLAANAAEMVPAVGQHGMMVEPGSFLSALCGTNDAINISGWAFDYVGRAEE